MGWWAEEEQKRREEGGGRINYKSKWNLLAEFESIGCDDDDGGRRVFF